VWIDLDLSISSLTPICELYICVCACVSLCVCPLECQGLSTFKETAYSYIYISIYICTSIMYIKVRMYAYNWYISAGNNDACQRFVAKDQQIFRSNNTSSFFLLLFIFYS
jgi:hypothetical protein